MAKSRVLSSLKGLSALVSGGSSGLGLATAERLGKLGCTVAIVDINEPQELPTNCYFIKADVTSTHDVMRALEIIENKATKLDILVNCSGIFSSNMVFNTETETPHPLDTFEHVLKVNTTGTFNMVRLCCVLFNKNEPNANKQRGVIINTASIAAFDGSVGCSAYAASKSAIVGMTLPLARDLANIGVRVVTIAPGWFQTPIYKNLSQNTMDSFVDLMVFPKRFGHPDEFAHMVQSIIENPMMNGEVIRLDGASRLPP